MVDHIILKFNSAAGADPMPRIRELTTELSLQVEELAEEPPTRHLRLVRVTGESKNLFELAKRLRRLPAVTAKIG